VLAGPFSHEGWCAERSVVGKRVQFDRETWQALDLLGKDSMRDFQELADEAFADLLKKHHRPVGLKTSLRESLQREPVNDNERKRGHAARRK
jgi:hypothetical protein